MILIIAFSGILAASFWAGIDTKKEAVTDAKEKQAEAKAKTLEDRKKIIEDRKKELEAKRLKTIEEREALKKAKQEKLKENTNNN